jgi:hypothetical protein
MLNAFSCKIAIKYHQIFGISLSNLAPKLKFAENWKSKNGVSE